MIEQSLAHPAHDTTGRIERVHRAQQLFEEHLDEFRYLGEGVYLVPSQNGHAGYEVTLKPETCECRDFEYRHNDGTPRCKHVIALRIYKAKTLPCAGCGERLRGRYLVGAGDDSLTFFEGQQICRECAVAHGIL